MARVRMHRKRIIVVVTTLVAVLAVAGAPSSAASRTVAPGPAASRSAVTGAASCAGFRNRIGVTNRTVTVANIADISGPVPGLYGSAQQAVQAYVRYFNATTAICGRRLRVLALDSRTDANAGQAAYTRACSQAFAAVGSVSLFDAGGAATAQHCGLPDLRAQTISTARYACSTCFSVQVDQPRTFENAVPDFFLAHHNAATQKAAMLYIDAGSARTLATTMQAAETRRGFHFVYTAGIPVSDFNYSAYVTQLQSHGVKLVQFVGPPPQTVRLAQAMHAANFTPEVFLLDPDGYSPDVARFADSAGAYVPVNFAPFVQGTSNVEQRRYKHWLHVVAPGAAPTPTGLFAWSAARLFAEQAVALGGQLGRIHLLTAVRGVHRWTANGLHAPQDVGRKNNGNCWRFLQLGAGLWNPVGGTAYLCSGKTVV